MTNQTTHLNGTFGLRIADVGNGYKRAILVTLGYPHALNIDGFGTSNQQAMDNLAVQIDHALETLDKMRDVVKEIKRNE